MSDFSNPHFSSPYHTHFTVTYIDEYPDDSDSDNSYRPFIRGITPELEGYVELRTRNDDGYRGLVYDRDDTGVYHPNQKKARQVERRLGIEEDVESVRRRRQRVYDARKKARKIANGDAGVDDDHDDADDENEEIFGEEDEEEVPTPKYLDQIIHKRSLVVKLQLSSESGKAGLAAYGASTGRCTRKISEVPVEGCVPGPSVLKRVKKAEENHENFGMLVAEGSGTSNETVSSTLVFCTCRKPDDGKFMIACDGPCGDWYHGACVGINAKEARKMDKYLCARAACNMGTLMLTVDSGTTCTVKSAPVSTKVQEPVYFESADAKMMLSDAGAVHGIKPVLQDGPKSAVEDGVGERKPLLQDVPKTAIEDGIQERKTVNFAALNPATEIAAAHTVNPRPAVTLKRPSKSPLAPKRKPAISATPAKVVHPVPSKVNKGYTSMMKAPTEQPSFLETLKLFSGQNAGPVQFNFVSLESELDDIAAML